MNIRPLIYGWILLWAHSACASSIFWNEEALKWENRAVMQGELNTLNASNLSYSGFAIPPLEWRSRFEQDVRQGQVFFNRIQSVQECAQKERYAWDWIESTQTISGLTIAFETSVKHVWVECPLRDHVWRRVVQEGLYQKTGLSWEQRLQESWVLLLNQWVIDTNMACHWGGQSCHPK